MIEESLWQHTSYVFCIIQHNVQVIVYHTVIVFAMGQNKSSWVMFFSNE